VYLLSKRRWHFRLYIHGLVLRMVLPWLTGQAPAVLRRRPAIPDPNPHNTPEGAAVDEAEPAAHDDCACTPVALTEGGELVPGELHAESKPESS
jgi:hypothetical protein